MLAVGISTRPSLVSFLFVCVLYMSVYICVYRVCREEERRSWEQKDDKCGRRCLFWEVKR